MFVLQTWLALLAPGAALAGVLEEATVSEGAGEGPQRHGLPSPIEGGRSVDIVRGSPEAGYPSAVGLGAGGLTLCSGSLIAPRVVLTAAHCSADLPIELVVQFGAAYVGDDASAPEATLSFTGAEIHPDYQPLTQTDLGENDVAVLFLEEDAPIEPVWFRTEPLKPRQTEGEVVQSVGWGIDENNEANVKRSAPLVIGSVDPVYLVSYNQDNDNEANICSGDSGGPQYHVEEDGTLVQWAVHSWGDVNCAFESGSTRVDKVADWILDQVEAEHGTRDRCVLFDKYGDGVCDADCDSYDIDCFEPFTAVPPRGCAAVPSPASLGWLGLVLLGVRWSGISRSRGRRAATARR